MGKDVAKSPPAAAWVTQSPAARDDPHEGESGAAPALGPSEGQASGGPMVLPPSFGPRGAGPGPQERKHPSIRGSPSMMAATSPTQSRVDRTV
jgi:hypothetical protein